MLNHRLNSDVAIELLTLISTKHQSKNIDVAKTCKRYKGSAEYYPSVIFTQYFHITIKNGIAKNILVMP